MSRVGWSVLGGVVGGFVVWLFQGHSLALLDNGMSYQDLAAIVLTAASLMVAIFGATFALIAVWGYTQFKRGVKSRTKSVVEGVIREHLVDELKNGPSRTVLDEIVAQFLSSAREKPGTAEAWVSAREEAKQALRELDDEL